MSYQFITKTSISNTTTQVTVSNLPQNYRHLVVFWDGTSSTSAGQFIMRINGISNLWYKESIFGNDDGGSLVIQRSGTNAATIGETAPLGSAGKIVFPDYAISTIKNWHGIAAAASVTTDKNGSSLYFISGSLLNTYGAITSLTFIANQNLSQSGLNFYIYGMAG